MFMFITLKNDGNNYHKVLTHEFLINKIEELNKIFDGKILMQYLILVGRADNKAQNPEMTKESFHLLDVMNGMLQELDIENN